MFKYTVNMDTFSERIKQNTTAERRITAEQILHLCRILAEQSKNKPFEFKANQEDRSSSKEIQSEDITSSRSSEQDCCDRVLVDAEEQQDQSESVIMGDNDTSYLTVPLIKTKQVKKDILNKIRNQIFERKRQKLATMQRNVTGVWRPW